MRTKLRIFLSDLRPICNHTGAILRSPHVFQGLKGNVSLSWFGRNLLLRCCCTPDFAIMFTFRNKTRFDWPWYVAARTITITNM